MLLALHLTPLKCRLLLVFAIWIINLLQDGYITTCLTVEYSGFSIYLSVAYEVVVLLLVSEDEKALGTCISCLTKVHPLLRVTPYVSKLAQLWFSITMIESTLQQTFVGDLNTGVCIISHFCIQIDWLQCYFLWENSFDAQKCLYWTACWQASFRGAHGKIAFLLASVVWCIWHPKCRGPKGTQIVFFFLSWLLLLLNSGCLIVLVL